MTRSRLVLLVILAFLAVGVYLYARSKPESPFVEVRFPIRETERLFDIGIVDADQDGRLDIFTANHHFRQSILIAQPSGEYKDVVTEWGLDQNRIFPWAELSFITPKIDKPGVYVFWKGTNLVIRRNHVGASFDLTGSLHTFDPVRVTRNRGSKVRKQETKHGIVTETLLSFSLAPDSELVLTPGGQGLPITFEFQDVVQPEEIYVGRGMVSPHHNRFTLGMQDRHAHAWADFNDDGIPDIYINRGALSGTLRAHRESIARAIKDELFLSTGPGRYVESGDSVGIEKNGCSGRHAKWVDYDGDGRIDLFVNCHDRGRIAGDFPKQLYRQEAPRRLRDVASEVGLSLSDRHLKALAWFDVEGDGLPDLLTLQDNGVILYQNHGARFKERIVTIFTSSPKAEKPSSTGGEAWVYDGHLSVGDYNGDGLPDVFVASTRGNVMLRNTSGRLVPIKPSDIGLPERSSMGQWTDFDNDGRLDLHLFPQGLFHQRPDGFFERTGWLAYDNGRYMAAIINWYDMDNDGRRDVLIALAENPDSQPLWSWGSSPPRKGRWKLYAYRNTLTAGRWLEIDVKGPPGNPSSIGARVIIKTPDRIQSQIVGASEGSIFSQGHYRLYFGLGQHKHVTDVIIRWSNGTEKSLGRIESNKIISVGPTP